MSQPNVTGVYAFDLRLMNVGHLTGRAGTPVALVVGVAESKRVSEVAAGTRKQMRALRNWLVVKLRNEPEVLDVLASQLAAVARKVPPLALDDAALNEAEGG
jgi:hypothetical protein